MYHMIYLFPLTCLLSCHFTLAENGLQDQKYTRVEGVLQNDLTIEQLNTEFEKHFAQANSITEADWERSLPNRTESAEMEKLIVGLFEFDDFSRMPSGFIDNFPQISKSIVLTVIQSGKFCVIHEPWPVSTKLFRRHWGYVIISATRFSSRPCLHHSAAHFQSDGSVCHQAAMLFDLTGSRTLVVAGASRFAVQGDKRSECQPENFVADAAHDNRTMFHTWNTAIWRVVQSKPKPEYFLQWHGMAETSCTNATAFLSIGVKAPHPIYSDDSSVINKLTSAIQNVSKGQFTSATPATSNCRLVASTNVFGRLVNGVRPGSVCRRNAKLKQATGQFISIEQKEKLRNRPLLWVKAIEKAVPLESSPKLK